MRQILLSNIKKIPSAIIGLSSILIFNGCGDGRYIDIQNTENIEGSSSQTVADTPMKAEASTLNEEPKKISPIEFTGIWADALVAAETGPEIKTIALMGHEWNVKPAQVSREFVDGVETIKIAGRLSHHIPLTIDDQVDYRFEFQNGEMIVNEINIQEGGWTTIINGILKIVHEIAPIEIPLGLVEVIINKVETELKGDWQDAGNRITVKLALAIYQRVSLTPSMLNETSAADPVE